MGGLRGRPKYWPLNPAHIHGLILGRDLTGHAAHRGEGCPSRPSFIAAGLREYRRNARQHTRAITHASGSTGASPRKPDATCYLEMAG